MANNELNDLLRQKEELCQKSATLYDMYLEIDLLNYCYDKKYNPMQNDVEWKHISYLFEILNKQLQDYHHKVNQTIKLVDKNIDNEKSGFNKMIKEYQETIVALEDEPIEETQPVEEIKYEEEAPKKRGRPAKLTPEQRKQNKREYNRKYTTQRYHDDEKFRELKLKSVKKNKDDEKDN